MRPVIGDLVVLRTVSGYCFGPYIFVDLDQDRFITVIKDGALTRIDVYRSDKIEVISSMDSTV